MRAARRGGDAVHPRPHALARVFGPADRAVEVEPVLLLVDGEHLAADRELLRLVHDPREVRREPVLVVVRVRRARRLVRELDREPAVQVGLRLEALGDELRVEARAREDLPVGLEVDRRAGAAGGADLLERARRLAAAEALLPLGAVALDPRDELLGERVHDRRTHAVQAARVVVVRRFELAAGVERRQDQLERGLLVLRVLVDRDAAPVVDDRARRAVLVERHADLVGVPVHGLVDRVVDDLPEKMVEARAVHAADVHGGPLR